MSDNEEDEQTNQVALKIGLIGDSQIGKTSLMVKYVEGSFNEDYIQTLGVNFMDKKIQIRNTTITFSIWDLGGQKEFINMLPLVSNDAVAILFMFDLTRKSTLNSVKEWYRQARGFNKTAIPFLIGTKYDKFIDLNFQDQLEITQQAKKFAQAMKAPVIFCSTSHSINVQKIFKIVLSKAFDLKLNLEEIINIGEPILIFKQTTAQGNMARHEKDFKGWQFILSGDSDEPSTASQNTPRRRSRRATQSKDTITLKRDSDDLELKLGDTILINDPEDSQTEVGLIKSINFGIDDLLEVLVIWFSFGEKNEIYITPYVDKIQVKDVIMKVNVLSSAEFDEIVIDESNSSSTYMTKRGEQDSELTTEFDYRDLIKKFWENPDEFVQYLRDTVFPSKYSSSNMEKRKQKQKVVIISDPKETDEDYKEPSNSFEESESESESEDLDDVVEFPPTRRTRSAAKPKQSRRRSTRLRKGTTTRSASTTTPTSSPRKQSKEIEQLYSTVLTPTKRRRIFKPSTPNLPNLISPQKPKPQEHLLDATSQAFKDIKAKLHTSQKLNSLPGREDEYAMIYMNLESAVNQETGCCIYISGVPGMGKTATIRDVISEMEKSNEVNSFNYLEINGLKLISPNVAYEMLWEQISGDKVSGNNAVLLLEEYFNRKDKKRKPFIILLDELDQIATKKQNVLYNFLNWPTFKTSKLIVIAVANTMDLPERILSNKISSRLGLRRIQFRGYTFDQLGDIIRHRLDMLSNKKNVTISPDAIGFASRKVASVSGDARRALTICRRAVEIAERDYNPTSNTTCQVTISHISTAINETINSPLSQYITTLPYMGKLLLVAILLRSKRTGMAENKLGDIIDELKLVQYKAKEDILESSLRIPFFKYVLNSLVESGILIQQNVQGERQRLIQLNVPEEEIISIFKRDKEVAYLIN
ncbi:Origin recognition complex subunit 1 [Spathaspora sp. JA1]|nr:Origin recognition complex subunit 1 [Spathaspora sp. JA1]